MNENIKIKFNANFSFTGLESLTSEKEAREGNGVDAWGRLILVNRTFHRILSDSNDRLK